MFTNMTFSNAYPTTVIKVALRFGIYAFGLMLLYFLTMSVFGLHQNPWLYIGNFLLIGIVIYRSYRHYVHRTPANEVSLFLNGLLTANIAAFFYGLFAVIYMWLINPAFLTYLQTHAPFGQYLTPYAAGVVIFATLAFGGFFIGYVLTLFFFDEMEEI